jgi:hypothetical protein
MASTYLQGAIKQGSAISDTAASSYVESLLFGTVSSAGAGTGAANFDLTIAIPAGARIIEILADTTAAWAPSGTASCTVGITAGGTEYVSGFDVKTITRGPTAALTAAQLAALAAPASTSVVIRVAVSAATGAGYAGTTLVTVKIAQLV